MSFHSFAFVFLFFPLCMLGFHMVKKTGKASYAKAFLVLMSLWFYGFVSPVNLPVLLVSMAVNFGIIFLMGKASSKKPYLIAGLVLSIGTLFFFKYTGQIFVPLSISFFTFSQIAILVEAYRGTLQRAGWLDYSFYVTFFPKMIQGPIVLPKELDGAVEEVMEKPFDWEKFYCSLLLFIMGLAKKVLLADTFGGAVDFGYGNLAALSSKEAWILILAYSLQLYFDFSGYSDMAMGCAGMLGFSLPVNFLSPYKAANIVEFWKGWHMTLTRFFTQYVYIPLGGNRKGMARTCLHILIVFFISGIWHGAGITFIVWGMMHGVAYVICRLWSEVRKPRAQGHDGQASRVAESEEVRFGKFAGKILRGIGVFVTFLYVNIAWVFFRAPSLSDAASVLKKAFTFGTGKIGKNFAQCFQLDEFWYVIKVLGLDSLSFAHLILMFFMLAIALLLVFFGKPAHILCEKIKPGLFVTVVAAVLFVWCVVSLGQVSSFLYVNF